MDISPQLPNSCDTQNDKRCFTRVPFVVDALISQDLMSWDTLVVDISLKGILVNSFNPLSLDKTDVTMIEISFDNGDTLTTPVALAHQSNSSYGFRFIDLDTEGMSYLRNLILSNLDDDSACERELMALFSRSI